MPHKILIKFRDAPPATQIPKRIFLNSMWGLCANIKNLLKSMIGMMVGRQGDRGEWDKLIEKDHHQSEK